jgi:hypothetical protein
MSWHSDFDEEKRSETEIFRFSKSERKQLNEEAVKRNMTKTDVVHHALFELFRNDKPHLPSAFSTRLGITVRSTER